MSAAELVGDLAVLYVELAAMPRPYMTWGELPNTSMRFDAWYGFGTPVFRLAVEAGIAVEHAAAPPREALAALADAVRSDEAALLHELHDALNDGFTHTGRELGYFYGGQPWDELCWFRSGLGFLADLAGVALDFDGYVDYYLDFYGVEMYEPLDPPPGMPRSHWWWFAASPPA